MREGHFTPSPLIERAAMRPRVYLAGFDIFRSDAFSHGRGYIVDCFGLSVNLMLTCIAEILVGELVLGMTRSRTSTNRTKVRPLPGN